MKNAVVVASLVLALLATNVFWLYRTFDNGVTMTYMEASLESATKISEQAVILANLNVVGRSAKDVIESIGTDVYGLEPFEKGGCVYVASVCLELDPRGLVSAVRTH